ncbi:hypothetical protein [Salinibacillus xinjiangensis]|uniref:Uncharacterized protein n=1 Tax=Salinibacillus xinjiangensis TaxID=1229268 RepID=A0A6G1X3Y9_9BACI|nr:hypothetical protein [Salinibacillus xinjiangensis]MRG85600.1 hypothetical protein [Salinibacillus xinjiangensis]
MRASGTARGYMAKNMETSLFLEHVLRCFRRELADQKRDVIIEKVDHDSNFLEIRWKEGEEAYFFLTNWNEIKHYQSKGPYAVDRFIIQKFKEIGFDFNHEASHYAQIISS